MILPFIALVSMAGSQLGAQATQYVGQDTIPGVVESTEGFLPQISHRLVLQPRHPENPVRRGIINPDGENNLPVGGLMDRVQGEDQSKFPGITNTGWSPPDPHCAAGPTHIVQVVNSSVAFFNRAGSKVFEQDLSTFFASVTPGPFVFDPKVVYDWHAGRFVLLALDEDDATQTSKVLFAVSAGSDPNGKWYKYRLEAKTLANGQACWGDYPGLGYNKDGYVISLNLFDFANTINQGVEIMAIRKATVINGGNAVVTKFVNTASDSFSVQVAEMLNPSANVVYMANAADTNRIKIWTVSGLSGTPGVPAAHLITVPSFVFPDSSGLESTQGHFLDDLDGRLINCMFVGTNLVTAHTVKAGTDDRRRVRWYEFWASPTGSSVPTLHMSGEVKQSGSSVVHFHMGAIGKAPNGDIAMIMSKSGPAGPVADIVRTIRKSTDPVGVMGAPALIDSASGPKYGPGLTNRWGDYAACSPDPLTQRLFWGTHMTGDSGTGWRTIIQSFALSATSTPGISSLTYPPIVACGSLPVTATIKTNAAAASVQTVYLYSSNTSLVTVPATATIPANSTTGTFTTSFGAGVNVATDVTITAKLNGVAFAKVLTLALPTISDFTLSPTSISANNSVTGTITLNGKPGSSGRVVSVSSDNPVAFPSAPTYTVPSGSRTRNITINTGDTTTTKTAHITATLGGSIMKPLTVTVPPALTGFTIVPASIKGGSTAVGKPVIASIAPAGGVLVSFADTSTHLTTPATALIAQGNTTVNVSFPTTTVTTSDVATVNCKLNGTTLTKTLTITP